MNSNSRVTVKKLLTLAMIFLIPCFSGYGEAEEYTLGENEVRPIGWAHPIGLAGAPNLHKVSDDLFRSAQPTGEGMKNLKNMGIETVVNLRSFHSDRVSIGNTGLAYEHIYMKAWRPEHKEIVRFLQIVTNPKRTPVLVHCQHGADRTGAMTAIYRIIVQGWSREEAVREMVAGGYGFHGIWKNLINWISSLDIEAIKKEILLSDEIAARR